MVGEKQIIEKQKNKKNILEKDNMKDTLKFIEIVNREMCDYLSLLTIPQLEDEIWDEYAENETNDVWDKKVYLQQVSKFLKQMIDNNYKIKRTYKYSLSSKNTKNGRIFVNGFGIQSLQHRLRGALLNGINYDYDMINCHPTILLYIAKKYLNFDEMEIPHLYQYVKNRDTILTKNYITKKEVLIALNSDRKQKTTNTWFSKIDGEFKQLQDLFSTLPIFHNIITDNKKNPKGSKLNKILCIYENIILQKIIHYCEEKKYIIHTPMFDGLTIETNKLCDDFNKITKEYGIKWIIKNHDDTIEIDEDMDFSDTYGFIKKEFEKKYFMCENPICFCEETISEYGLPDIIIRNTYDFNIHTRNVRFIDCDGKKESFFTYWLEDINMRRYRKLDFLAPPNICPQNVYNLYSGMIYEKLYFTDDELKDIDTSIYYEHLKFLSGNEKTDEVYDTLKKYLSHLIQKPGELPKLAILFRSVEGTGKNMFFDNFMKNIIGQVYYKCDTDIDDLIGKFADLTGRFITIVNEMSGNATFQKKVAEKVKGLITEEFMSREDKGIKRMNNIKNTNRILAFTNSFGVPYPITPTDRRFLCIDIGNKVKEPLYYKKLYLAMNDIKGLYKFVMELKKVDIENYDFQMNRPITEYHKVISQTMVSCIDRYVINQIYNKYFICEKGSTELYNNYVDWCSGKEYKPATHSSFSRHIQMNTGITHKRGMKNVMFSFNLHKMLDYLGEKNLIDEDQKIEYRVIIEESLKSVNERNKGLGFKISKDDY